MLRITAVVLALAAGFDYFVMGGTYIAAARQMVISILRALGANF